MIWLQLCAQIWTGLPRWLNSKQSTFECRRPKRRRFHPWVGKIPWEEGIATHSSIFAWGIPWQRSLVGYIQSIEFQRFRHDWKDLFTLKIGIIYHPLPMIPILALLRRWNFLLRHHVMLTHWNLEGCTPLMFDACSLFWQNIKLWFRNL